MRKVLKMKFVGIFFLAVLVAGSKNGNFRAYKASLATAGQETAAAKTKVKNTIETFDKTIARATGNFWIVFLNILRLHVDQFDETADNIVDMYRSVVYTNTQGAQDVYTRGKLDHFDLILTLEQGVDMKGALKSLRDNVKHEYLNYVRANVTDFLTKGAKAVLCLNDSLPEIRSSFDLLEDEIVRTKLSEIFHMHEAEFGDEEFTELKYRMIGYTIQLRDEIDDECGFDGDCTVKYVGNENFIFDALT